MIFASRWLQLPLYLGLIIAQGVYVWLFWQELYYLLLAAFGNTDALNHVLDAVTVQNGARYEGLNETVIMLVVLGLIDVVMISNLLIMVIVGGNTFINAAAYEEKTLVAQVGIHITFLLSAMAIGASDRLMPRAPSHAKEPV
jgi:uncharacterized membrane protein YqhA